MLKKPKLAAISRALSNNAKKLVCLVRMISIMPQHILTMLCGISHMTTKDYLIGQLGMMVCDMPTIYLGASMSSLAKAGSGTSDFGPLNWIALIGGGILVVVVIVIITVYARREFNKEVESSNESKG